MATRDREEQARQEQERQEQDQQRQQQERMGTPRALLNDGDDESSTNPVIVNH